MSRQDTDTDWPVLGRDDPPLDSSRENAAYAKERDRLVREHPGKIALIHGDDVIGVFPTADEALLEGFRRFGLVRMVLSEILPSDGPEYFPHVDVTHPSFQRLE